MILIGTLDVPASTHPTLWQRLVARWTRLVPTEPPPFAQFCADLHIDTANPDAVSDAAHAYRVSYGVDPTSPAD